MRESETKQNGSMDANRSQDIPRADDSASQAPSSEQEIVPLPLRKVITVAFRGIRVRIWRSLLVVSCIVLAISFLTYILSSDLFIRNVQTRGSQTLMETLVRDGIINPDAMANQRVQTYWMVGLALMISFVGIVNAMLMSVTERFREIGTMKCLGALDGFVLKLFLIESLLEGAVGTLAGLVLGLLFAYGEGIATYGAEVWTLAPGAAVGVNLSACFAAGLVLTVLGALYPAYQAARMPPVMALRSEV